VSFPRTTHPKSALKSRWHAPGNPDGVRRPILRALAGSLALTLVTLGLLSSSARLVSHLTTTWFGPLPEIVEAEEPTPEPEAAPAPKPTARSEILPPRAAPKKTPKPEAAPKPTARSAVLAPRVAPARKAPKPAPILADPAPAKPTERLAFRPHRENGKVTGLEYGGGASGSLFDLLGLQKGDVLVDINGYSLNDPEEGLRAYSALRRAAHLRVKLLRSGRPLEIVIHML
jgi:hypothetical protein